MEHEIGRRPSTEGPAREPRPEPTAPVSLVAAPSTRGPSTLLLDPAAVRFLQRTAGNSAVASRLRLATPVVVQRQNPNASGSAESFAGLGDPERIVAALAAAPPAERQYLAADPAGMKRLQEAIGPDLWPVAQRILTGAASVSAPSIDEATWFRCDRAIKAEKRAEALQVLITTLAARGIVSAAQGWTYVARSDEGDAVTRFAWEEDPSTHLRRATNPRVEVFDPAFVSVSWLLSSVLHENVHVAQVRAGMPGEEFDAKGDQRPEFAARDEVLAYLFEIEHAAGTGLTGSSNAAGNQTSPEQWRTNVTLMKKLAGALTREFNKMTPALQATFKTRYDRAQQLVRNFDLGVPQLSVEDARRTVQESSQKIQELLARRRSDNAADIDAQVEEVRRKRSEAMAIVTLTDNPLIEVVEAGDPGVYRVPTVDASGQVQYLHAGLQVAWHIAQSSTSVYGLGRAIGAGGQMAVAGTAVQGRVHPFPPDIDFDEHLDVVAETRPQAGRIAAEQIIAAIRKISGGPTPGRSDLEFRSLASYPVGGSGIKLALGEVLGGGAVPRLGAAIAALNGGNLNTYWRGYIVDDPTHPEERRLTPVTRVVFISAKKKDGTELLAPSGNADFNMVFLDDPGEIPATSLAEFAAKMAAEAIRQASFGQWLKAAKRAFNYCSTIGDLAGMNELQPVFSTPQTRVEQFATVLDGISSALGDKKHPQTEPRTRIVSLDEARRQVERVAATVETTLPRVPGKDTPEAIARDLRTLATRLESRDQRGNLKQNFGLAGLFGSQAFSIRQVINEGVQAQVKPVIERIKAAAPPKAKP